MLYIIYVLILFYSVQADDCAPPGKGDTRVEKPLADHKQRNWEAEQWYRGARDFAPYPDVRRGNGQGLPARHLTHEPIPGSLLSCLFSLTACLFPSCYTHSLHFFINPCKVPLFYQCTTAVYITWNHICDCPNFLHPAAFSFPRWTLKKLTGKLPSMLPNCRG